MIIRTQAESEFQRKYAGHVLSKVRPKEQHLTAANLLRDNRIYVACQTSDDFSYVVEYAGEDSLIVGTDYGHADYSNDIEAISNTRRQWQDQSIACAKDFDGQSQSSLWLVIADRWRMNGTRLSA